MRGVLARDRQGASLADALVFMATLSVASALLYPAWSVREFRERVDMAIADVTEVSAAARTVLDETNRWPAAAPVGEPPAELTTLTAAGDPFDREGYTLQWTSWEVVDSVEAPPSEDLPSPDDLPQDSGPLMVPVVQVVGAVAVHTGEEDLIAELMDHFAGNRSLVMDTTWLLMLPERARQTDDRGFGLTR